MNRVMHVFDQFDRFAMKLSHLADDCNLIFNDNASVSLQKFAVLKSRHKKLSYGNRKLTKKCYKSQVTLTSFSIPSRKSIKKTFGS